MLWSEKCTSNFGSSYSYYVCVEIMSSSLKYTSSRGSNCCVTVCEHTRATTLLETLALLLLYSVITCRSGSCKLNNILFVYICYAPWPLRWLNLTFATSVQIRTICAKLCCGKWFHCPPVYQVWTGLLRGVASIRRTARLKLSTCSAAAASVWFRNREPPYTAVTDWSTNSPFCGGTVEA